MHCTRFEKYSSKLDISAFAKFCFARCTKKFFALACTNFRSFVFIFEAIVVVNSAHAFFYVGEMKLLVCFLFGYNAMYKCICDENCY